MLADEGARGLTDFSCKAIIGRLHAQPAIEHQDRLIDRGDQRMVEFPGQAQALFRFLRDVDIEQRQDGAIDLVLHVLVWPDAQ